MKVWTYWEGPTSPVIELCLEKFRSYGCTVLDPKSFDLLWESDRDVGAGRLRRDTRSDFIRYYLLRHYGGVWLDADCVLYRDPHELLDIVKDRGPISIKNRGRRAWNGMLGAEARSPMIEGIYRKAVNIVRTGGILRRVAIGPPLLYQVKEVENSIRFDLHHFQVHFCDTFPAKRLFIKDEDLGHERLIVPDAYCSHLGWWVCGRMKKWSRERILEGKELVSYFFRRSREASTSNPS